MGSQYSHLSDEELLLFADGELSSRQIAPTEAHLAECWDCRARLRQIEATITDFLHVHHRTFDPQLPPSDGPRALLRARLVESGAGARRNPWFHQFQRAFAGRKWIYAPAVTVLVVLGTGLIYRQLSASRSPQSVTLRAETGFMPDRRLTPGAVRPVTMNEVCTVNYSDDAGSVPASVRQAVFSEYGIVGVRAALGKDYELDYLISPQLGGSDDIRNLWPESSLPTGWNLRAKDALENRLHQLVCQGKLNLSTAQSDLATDWIATYKRYFQTDRPIQPL